MVEAIAAINSSAASGDPAATLTALKMPAAGIRSLSEDCAGSYTEKLAAARQDKVDSGKSMVGCIGKCCTEQELIYDFLLGGTLTGIAQLVTFEADLEMLSYDCFMTSSRGNPPSVSIIAEHVHMQSRD